MSNNDISDKLRRLRTKLSGIINDEALATLLEAEKRLAGGVLSLSPAPKPLKKNSRLTKAQLREKFSRR